MKIFRQIGSLILTAVLCFSLLPTVNFASAKGEEALGNSDLNILNGGVMLRDGGDFYFNHQGIFLERNGAVTALSADDGKNLNLYDGYIYYTVGSNVRRLPKDGGPSQPVFKAQADINQLYVCQGSLLFVAEGLAYSVKKGGDTARKISGPSGIKGLIPTAFGNLFLTGEVFNYTLWAEDTAVLENLDSCYTDSGYLAISIDNQNYMAELSSLFNDFKAETGLLPFAIHGNVATMDLLAPDNENAISEYNENNNLTCDFDKLLEDAGLAGASLMYVDAITGEEIPDPPTAPVIPEVSQGQLNMVKRARQLTEIQWTPLEDRYQWDYRGVFKAENTYTGIPYGQPVNNNGYVGYGVSLTTYANGALDNTSKFYTAYSTYNKISPAFSTDCSGYVSYAWGLSGRKTTYSLPQVSEKVGDQSMYSLQVGDALNKIVSHVVIVSGLKYDAEGKIIWIQIMEQTPVIAQVTNYGQGETRSLASFQSYYLNNGYEIYRYAARGNVSYTSHPAVPLDGETPAGMKEKAPKTTTSPIFGGKSVALSPTKAGAIIHYTTDGSVPTVNSPVYSAPFDFTSVTKLRAIQVSSDYSDYEVLSYTVKIPQAELPKYESVSGEAQGNIISAGSKIKLTSMANTTIYYTTDGSDPTTSSAVYSSPITINSDITIRAFAEGKGVSRSNIATLNFKIGQLFTINASAGSGGSISSAGNSNVLETGSKSYTITPSNGYKIQDVTVDGVSQGAISSFTFSNVTANHSIAAIFKVSSGMQFTDVPSDAWFYEAVSFAYANNLFKGVSDTQFAPEVTTSRGMFTAVLARFAGVGLDTSANVGLVTGEGVNIRQEASTSSEKVGFVENKNTAVQVLGTSADWYKIKHGSVTGYIRNDLMKVYSGAHSDLVDGTYYTPAAKWASLTGITNGVAGSAFMGESAITREHMAMMMYNYATLNGITLKTINAKVTFADDAQISQNAKTAVYALQQAGVINGMGENLFAPQGGTTRAQAAQVFMALTRAVG